MATITAVEQSLTGISTIAKKWLWEQLTTANTDGNAVNVSAAAVSITVQVIGTFGATSVGIQGSNDGTNWFVCKDQTGTAIAITSAGGVSLSDLPLYVRPLLTGGGGTTDIDVIMLVR